MNNNLSDIINCSICYENILLINLNCSHKICVECLINLKKNVCPICRVELDYLPKKIKKIIYKNNSKNNLNNNNINNFNYSNDNLLLENYVNHNIINDDLFLENFINQSIINDNNDNNDDDYDPSQIDKYFT